MISLFVVRELAKRGVPLAEIAKAERYGRREFGVDRPFVRYDVATDGSDVCFEAHRDESKPRSVESANRQGQRVLVEPIREELRSVRYSEGDNGLAYAWAPLDGVLLDPTIQFGTPVVSGTRVPADVVVELTEELGLEGTARRLSLEAVQVKAAVRFHHQLIRQI